MEFLIFAAAIFIITFGVIGLGILLLKADFGVIKFIGLVIMLAAALSLSFTFDIPKYTKSGMAANTLIDNYHDLEESVRVTKDYHGNISKNLYNLLDAHNVEVDKCEQTFWTKTMFFKPDKYKFDLNSYTVAPATETNTEVESIVENTMTTVTTETVTTTTETLKKVVEINGEYYELVPIN